ncbi:MAG: tetratricopeptide repeat protein [Alistipes sp.]|nr:tetratricopeptide repeat protein [Alistipes sp.]
MKRIFTILFFLSLSVVTSLAQTDAQTAQANVEETEQAQPAESASASDNTDDLWQRANTAYNSGDYAQAEACYTRILEQGLYSASLYYNLANAHFKQNELGKALLYYNRALRLRPNDEDIRHNLEYAKQSTKDSIEEIPEFFLKTWIKSLRGALSCTTWSILSLVMLATALAFGLIYMLAQRLSLRKTGFYLMAIAALLFVVTTAFAWSERNMLIKRSEAIVMDSAVSIKSSPDRSATELFVLHEGTKVTIGEAIDGWAEVRIADGRKGWIEEERIERI